MVSKFINSKTYVLGLTQENLFKDIYKIFYNILSKNITVSGKERVWFSAFPDINIDNSEDYPFFIINSVMPNYNNYTQTKDLYDNSLEIEIHTTAANLVDDYASQILYQVNSNKHYLRKLGIRNLTLDSADQDMVMRDKIKIHTKSLTFNFDYVLTKVSASW